MGGQKKTIATAFKINISNNVVLNIDEVTGYIAFVNHQQISANTIGDTIFDTIERIKKILLLLRNVRKFLPKIKATEKLRVIVGTLSIK